MTFFSTNLKMGRCLEWCTQLPSATRDLRKSPVFYIENVECYFYIGNDSQRYYLCLYNCGQVKKSFSLAIYANYGGKLFSREISNVQDKIFDYLCSLKFLTEFKKPASLFGRFTFIFEQDTEVELSLPTETKTEDKTVQTKSLSDDRSIQTGSYLNGNVSSESMPDDFSKLLETGFNHDAEIKCGEHSFKVHKAVLCARSEVLKTMLQSNFLEGQTGVMEIQDMDTSYFRDFIHYLYTGLMPELTFDKAKMLYEVGDKYDVRSLMFRCSEYLQDNLSKENAFECFLLGDAHSDQNLKNRIKEFILDKKMYLEEEYWAPFCEKFPMFTTDLYRLSYKRRKIAED